MATDAQAKAEGFAVPTGEDLIRDGDDAIRQNARKATDTALVLKDVNNRLGSLLSSYEGHTHTWTSVTGKPAVFPPELHQHPWTDITNRPATFPPSAHDHSWDSITSKPATFPPSTHVHDWDSITSKPATFPPATHAHDWASITSKPTQFPPSPHTHSAADITTGVVSPSRLGSGTPSASTVLYGDGAWKSVALPDTGVRNVASLVAAADSVWVVTHAFLQRVGNNCTLSVAVRVPSGTATANRPLMTLPAGFTTNQSPFGFGIVATTTTPGNFTRGFVYGSGATVISRGTTAGTDNSVCYGSTSWYTNDPWPTTLPGVAV